MKGQVREDALDYHRRQPAGKVAIRPTKPTATQRASLEAAYLLMASGDNRRPPWPMTLLALDKAGGHQKVANFLAVAAGRGR